MELTQMIQMAILCRLIVASVFRPALNSGTSTKANIGTPSNQLLAALS